MLFRSPRGTAVLAALLFALMAAISARAADAETRAFTSAEKLYSDGLYPQAERAFADFARSYPASLRLSQAVLRQAQAALEQKNFRAAIQLLSTNMTYAAGITDQFQYWLGRVQFLGGQHEPAANSFALLIARHTNSTLRLEAALGEAQARFELRQWRRVSELLRHPAGAFQSEAARAPESGSVLQGRLLLAEALLEQRQFAEAVQTLDVIPPAGVTGERKWRRDYLHTKAQFGGQQLEAALASSSNLVATAATTRQPALEAASIALQGEILEGLNQPDAAIVAYQQNQRVGVPLERLREAVFKTVKLTLAQGRITNAVAQMEAFLQEHPGENGSDMALVTLAELRLRQHQMWNTISTNPTPDAKLLADAIEECGRLLRDFTNSPFAGNAQLVRGWALLAQGRAAESQSAFRAATEHLPWSEAGAVARFKLADLEFQGREYTNAISDYRRVITDYAALPRVQEELVPRARFQMLQASREAGDLAAADEAMAPLLAEYPVQGHTERTLLLYGQVTDELGQAASARQILFNLRKHFPSSTNRPAVELAIIRTFERERNWPEAVARYESWVGAYPSNANLAQAEFQRALASDQAGRETNALVLFTNFIARFPTNALGARAQDWVGDFYYRHDQFVAAEQNYQLVSQNWPATELSYHAQLKAGRAALQRFSFDDATNYFTAIINDDRSPAKIIVLAYFAYGDAYLQRPSTNALDRFSKALNIYSQIEQFIKTQAPAGYSSDPLVLRAWGQMANCQFQLASTDPAKYALALALYQKVTNAVPPDVAILNQAEVGLGRVQKQQARLALEEGRKAEAAGLLDAALNNFLRVVYTIREGDAPDPFWVKEAALDAGVILEEQGKWKPALELYRRLIELIPELKTNPALEKRISSATEKAALQKE